MPPQKIYKPKGTLASYPKIGQWIKENCQGLEIADWKGRSTWCNWNQFVAFVVAVVEHFVEKISLVTEDSNPPQTKVYLRMYSKTSKEIQMEIHRVVLLVFKDVARFDDGWVVDAIASLAVIRANSNIRLGTRLLPSLFFEVFAN
jgi:hypothetical protein